VRIAIDLYEVLMELLLYFAALLIFATGIVHSVLGERYILIRLFRCDNLPMLFGSTEFTTRTLRFAWHLTTIAWWGLATILVLMANPPLPVTTLGGVIGSIFFASFLLAIVGSRGRHLSWIVFLVTAMIALYVAVI